MTELTEQMCSARGCRAAAEYALLWRNPAIHDESRIKIWLACEVHGGTLHEYLASRGFPVEPKPIGELTEEDVAASQPRWTPWNKPAPSTGLTLDGFLGSFGKSPGTSGGAAARGTPGSSSADAATPDSPGSSSDAAGDSP